MRQTVHESTNSYEHGGLLWSVEDGFQFQVPDGPQDKPVPMPLYLLGLCFMRFSTDPSFGQELIDWANRNQN